MPNRKTRPTSPGRRFGTYPMREELTKGEPEKGLTKGKTSSGGRNSNGRVTARHRGGGAKRRYRTHEARALERNHVHVAFDDDDRAGAAGCCARLCQAVEDAPLLEKRRIG